MIIKFLQLLDLALPSQLNNTLLVIWYLKPNTRKI